MDGDCRFFEIDAWERRVRRHVGRVWDLETYLRKVEDGDTDARIEEFAEASGADPSALAVTPIGELTGDDHRHSEILIEQATEAWRRDREWLPDACPHDPVDGTDRCPFHLAPSEYDSEGITASMVTDRLHEALDAEDEQEKCFVGARFLSLDLSDTRVETTDNEPLDFRLMTVRDGVNCTNASFEPSVMMEGAIFAVDAVTIETSTGSTSNRYISLDAEIDFGSANFEDTADFKHALFDAPTSFNGADCDDLAMFNYATFTSDLELWATFRRKVDFSKADIQGVAQIRSTFDHAAIFNYTEFGDDVVLWNSTFAHKAEFLAAKVRGDFDCKHARFKSSARFIETVFEAGVTFEGSAFTDQAHFRRVKCPGSVIHLDEVTVNAGRIELGPEPVHFDLRKATLGSVTVSTSPGADLAADPLAYLNISQTVFEGFDFASHARSFKPDWRVDDLADSWPKDRFDPPDSRLERYERLEDTYLRAKSGAITSGHNKAASEFFVHEMIYRRKQHGVLARRRLRQILVEEPSSLPTYLLAPVLAVGRTLRAGLDRIDPRSGRSHRERAATPAWLAGYRWFSNGSLSLVAGYGERPKRPLVLSAVIVTVFAVFYWLAGTPPTSDGPLGTGYLLLSIQSFITFILGSSPVRSAFLPQLLSSVEGFAGAFLTAVFVFTLTRSIHR